MRAGLAVDAITSTHRAGLVAGNAITHTDRGSQYHSRADRNALQRLEIRQSTSRTGSCLDGAAAESFFATLKTEIGARSWQDRADARRDIENRIADYNQRRLHSSIDYQTPASARRARQQHMPTAAQLKRREEACRLQTQSEHVYASPPCRYAATSGSQSSPYQARRDCSAPRLSWRPPLWLSHWTCSGILFCAQRLMWPALQLAEDNRS